MRQILITNLLAGKTWPTVSSYAHRKDLVGWVELGRHSPLARDFGRPRVTIQTPPTISRARIPTTCFQFGMEQ